MTKMKIIKHILSLTLFVAAILGIKFANLTAKAVPVPNSCPCFYIFSGDLIGGHLPTWFNITCHSNGVNHMTGWNWTNGVILCPQGDEVEFLFASTNGACDGNAHMVGEFSTQKWTNSVLCAAHSTYDIYLPCCWVGGSYIVLSNYCNPLCLCSPPPTMSITVGDASYDIPCFGCGGNCGNGPQRNGAAITRRFEPIIIEQEFEF